MLYISTRSHTEPCSFSDAVLHGLALDGGLYIPEKIPPLTKKNISAIFQAIDIPIQGTILLKEFMPEISSADLAEDLHASLNFSIPLVHLYDDIYLLEVFHGPTLAFKDVGARFMARILARILHGKNHEMDILVATSGDTGSAVAQGFHGVPGIRVFVLYPSGRITFLQEQQMATLGGNIFPLEIDGSFDDCQRLVKEALQDRTLPQQTGRYFSTANSINIARLLPQMVYHATGVVQLKKNYGIDQPVLAVPSGNLGNIVSAIYANACGIPIQHFIAATNSNTVLKEFFETGNFVTRTSQATFSSAMDVGNPSNFERLQSYFNNSLTDMQKALTVISVDNEKTLATIRSIYKKTGYIADPHTAVGITAAEEFRSKNNSAPIIVTATAHPAKFPEVIKEALGDIDLSMPASLQKLLNAKKTSQLIAADYAEFREILCHCERAL